MKIKTPKLLLAYQKGYRAGKRRSVQSWLAGQSKGKRDTLLDLARKFKMLAKVR